MLASVNINLDAEASARFTTPDPESITMFPVVAPPRVRVPILRDWIVPVEPVNESPRPFVVALIVAVGVPSLIPVTANSAVAVALLPKRRSRVEVSLGVIVPFRTFQLDPVPVQDAQEGTVPPIKQSFDVPTAV